jgi:hypothetical protein
MEDANGRKIEVGDTVCMTSIDRANVFLGLVLKFTATRVTVGYHQYGNKHTKGNKDPENIMVVDIPYEIKR